MTETSALPVSALSEGELLARFTPLLPRGRATLVPTGDDAAVVAAPDGRFVVSTDVLVEDHHFRRGWGTARDLGARAAAQNLADVAAMGAVPTSTVVGLVLPPATPVAWVEGLARGLADVCAPLGVGVDGGDLSAGEQLVVAVTAHGDLEGRAPVLRSGARPGDVLAHAGGIGAAAAGLAVLTTSPEDDDGAATAAVAAFLRPAPPYAAGPAAADAGASAMMDVSDGLLRDAGRLARASGVEVVLDPLADSLPGDLAALTPLAARHGAAPEAWVLTGGEDHGLLATFPAEVTLPPGFRRLGSVRAGQPRVLTAPQDARHAAAVGWDHFRR
ncbi:thiamine-phosphate kinase [Georgenia satyanarayanai]|uniref:thiamine-phosphate kinase n=1 Tax=Georgenia satyanarayanai TaxID=860221 RepID=UPI0012655A50|nr:thiamine-phosphate kinase [Georgenia satyanarayanai]